MLEQLGGPQALQGLPGILGRLGGGGPVNWELAGQAARQLAADGDRQPTEAEAARHTQALELAEHWLDESPLPAPPDGGQLRVASRQEWVQAALQAMRPLVEPISRASTRALVELARDELADADLEDLGLGPLASLLEGVDVGRMLESLGATMAGMQAGQVIGRLAGQMLGHYELGLPTAPRSEAFAVAVNIAETFEGWGLDDTEVAVTLALHEAAHRRLFHGVPWLQAHVEGLIVQFANGTEMDPHQLHDLSQELLLTVDPEDPESLQEAMREAAHFRLQPTAEQRRVLERLQGVVTLVGGWARHEVAACGHDRLPDFEAIEEVLRRRRATKGDGEELLQQLLGLDLQPADETVGVRFVEAVKQARGPTGPRQALAHPENLPDSRELADPDRWLARTSESDEVPDDPSALFGEMEEAPVERSADERLTDREDDEDPTGPDDGDRDGGGGGPAGA